MNAERVKVLEMLQQAIITVDEADDLLEALGSERPPVMLPAYEPVVLSLGAAATLHLFVLPGDAMGS